MAAQLALGFKPALISKGLRLTDNLTQCADGLQASPDFKGIKTVMHGIRQHRNGFKPALISKGLRP